MFFNFNGESGMWTDNQSYLFLCFLKAQMCYGKLLCGHTVGFPGGFISGSYMALKNDLMFNVHIAQILTLLKNLCGTKYQFTFFFKI